MASQTIETGGAKSWLTAGINHHLAMVAHQLQDVAATPARSAAENEGAPDWPAHF
jgi:hypothetical protein